MCRNLLADRDIPGLWKALAEGGLLGLAIAEEYGGSGGRLTDLGVFCVEAGRALCPMAVHSTVQAALALDWLGSRQVRVAWLPGLAAGTVRATTALWNARDAASPGAVRASAIADGWCLSGAADFVYHDERIDVVVVGAGSAAGTKVFVVDADSPGIAVEPLVLMGGHRATRIVFDDVAVSGDDRVLDIGESEMRRVANAAVALLCLDLVGVGEAVLARTVKHTTMREQFGRPIASFQAAQHLVANIRIALTAARLSAQSALFWIGRGRVGTRETAIAKMHATAIKQVTLDAHQLHGGMGYVVDTDLHLFSERARLLSTLGGGADVAAKWLEDEMDWENAQ